MRQLIFAIIIAGAAIIFALQNADPVTINFFFWEFSNTSMALVLMITLVIGLLAGMLFVATGIYKRNRVISNQKKRILELEKQISK
jgi:lipopolysaccharide assembly protein A